MTTLRENIFNGAEKSKGQNQATMPRRNTMPFAMSFEGVSSDPNGDFLVPVSENGMVDVVKLVMVTMKVSKKKAKKVFCFTIRGLNYASSLFDIVEHSLTVFVLLDC